MANELRMAMLTAVFAVAMVISELAFINQRSREEAALLLRSLAISQAGAVPQVDRSFTADLPRRLNRTHRGT
jgi:hypothetical protein